MPDERGLRGEETGSIQSQTKQMLGPEGSQPRRSILESERPTWTTLEARKQPETVKCLLQIKQWGWRHQMGGGSRVMGGDGRRESGDGYRQLCKGDLL